MASRDQPGEEPGGNRVELADVTEGEQAQKRAQRRGRPNTLEQPAHPTMAQQIHVIDAASLMLPCVITHPYQQIQRWIQAKPRLG
jgi:hypothetical protein